MLRGDQQDENLLLANISSERDLTKMKDRRWQILTLHWRE